MKKIIFTLSVIMGTILIFSSCTSHKKEESHHSETQHEYVDLGLPSGTLWKQTNENDSYTFDGAIEYFDGFLPTSGQFQELLNYCTWEWNGHGYKVIGKNGNHIFLSAMFDQETLGAYWSKTKEYDRADCCFGLLFFKENFEENFEENKRVDRTCSFDRKRSIILCK